MVRFHSGKPASTSAANSKSCCSAERSISKVIIVNKIRFGAVDTIICLCRVPFLDRNIPLSAPPAEDQEIDFGLVCKGKLRLRWFGEPLRAKSRTLVRL